MRRAFFSSRIYSQLLLLLLLLLLLVHVVVWPFSSSPPLFFLILDKKWTRRTSEKCSQHLLLTSNSRLLVFCPNWILHWIAVQLYTYILKGNPVKYCRGGCRKNSKRGDSWVVRCESPLLSNPYTTTVLGSDLYIWEIRNVDKLRTLWGNFLQPMVVEDEVLQNNHNEPNSQINKKYASTIYALKFYYFCTAIIVVFYNQTVT